MTGRVTSASFIGRQEELGRLHRALQSAVAGEPTTVLIAGEAGVGKTRLVEELADQVRDRAGRDRRCERRIRGMPRKARARRHAGRTSSAPQRSFVGCTGEAMGFSLPHSAADEFVAPGRLSS
jgi:predicted ATPase